MTALARIPLLFLPSVISISGQVVRPAPPRNAVCSRAPGNIRVAVQPVQRSLLNLLFATGAAANACISFEAADRGLFDKELHVPETEAPVRDILKAALHRFPRYCLSEQENLLVVAPCRRPGDSWLDYRIEAISWERNFLQAFSNGLYWAIVGQIHPSDGAFGHFLSGDTTDVIGPYHFQNLSIRVLLNRFIQDSNGAMWFTNQPFERGRMGQQPDTPERFWTVREYHDDPRRLPGTLELDRAAAANAFAMRPPKPGRD